MKNTLMTGVAALALIAGSLAGSVAAQEAKISDGKVKIGVLNLSLIHISEPTRPY